MLIREKVQQAVKLLQEMNVDCWITFVRESQLNGDPVLAYLAPGDVTWHSAFVVSASGETLAIVGRYDQKTIEDTRAWDNVIGFVEGFKAPLSEHLQRLAPSSIALNYSEGSEICDGLTHGMYLTLEKLLGEIGMGDRIVSAEPIVSALRERKTPEELSRMRDAARQTVEIFDAVTGFIRPGVSEQEIAAFMKQRREERGLEAAWEEAHCPAVFTGPETAGAHYAPSERKVEPGHVLNMDFGVKVGGYCSDMQRSFYVLEPGQDTAPPEVQRGFETILRSIEEARQAIHPGARGRDIDAVARGIIVEAGYEEFPHALGHQVGRFSHDGTALLGPMWEKYADKPNKALEPNMVLTIEPRLTVPERGVVTVEELVVVTRDGADYLVPPQRELILIPAST